MAQHLLPLSLFDPLKKYLEGKKRILIIRPRGNVGDALIFKGMSALLSGLPYGTMHVDAFLAADVLAFEHYDVICWGGGGNVSGRYPYASEFNKLFELKRMFGMELCVFPQSIEHYGPWLKQFDVMFLRDIHSVFTAQINGHPNTVLIPDLAFGNEYSPQPISEIETGDFFRADTESTGRFKDRVNDPRRPGEWLEEFLALARSVNHVHTDLLHFTVAALLQGRKVTLYPTNWHKTKSLYATWLHHLNCTFAK